MGFVLTKEDLTEIRDMMLAKKVPAATCADAIAMCEVTVPAQNTDLGPEKTSFFQALRITMKISGSTIEILSDVYLLKIREKMRASKAILLNMLNLSPFFFGPIIQQLFDNGSIYNQDVLDITEKTAFPLPGGHPQSCQCLSADWLPNFCISTIFYHHWVQMNHGFVCGD
ncbi:hypothetical protein HJG60_008500 [Phyllostomus discolor]|uniref:Large ribosomal subunit protein uL10 n=1 Tax=Phyllostomus discolor TaxID=89673 RepID=A0A834DN67_9CHIR|nr:hypothetical protein HJG60_008500 [Phyllostomus discolor]